MFSKPIDVKDSNEAEIKTIRKALQVFKVSYSSHLIGESDSTVAVSWVGSWVTKPKDSPLRFNYRVR